MRHLLAAALAALFAPAALAQTPAAEVKTAGGTTLLRLNTDGGLVVRSSGAGAIPATGSGARLMWHAGKNAFRVGRVNGPAWDDVNVGEYSFAAGYDTKASGSTSTALGLFTEATGDFSTAVGYATTASGDISTAMGFSTSASSFASVAIGRYNTVDLFGGWNATAWEANDPLFVAGNGSGTGNRSNALFLRKDGNLTIAGTLTQNSDARLKEGVATLTGALARVIALRPVTYQFVAGTNRPGGVQVGLIAQEVQAVYPELVREEADGYLSVAYGNLAPVAVAAIQEQQRAIERQGAEIALLRAEIGALRATLETALARRSAPVIPAASDRR